MIFKNNKVYDWLKWIASVALPAIAAFYFALSQIWGFPYAEQIVATIAAITALADAILGISAIQYKRQTDKLSGNSYIEEDNR